MLYFKIVVVPAGTLDQGRTDRQGVAHVMTDLREAEIENAASLVVKRLHADHWRIVHVLEARPVMRKERFFDDDFLRHILADAENTGFAFAVETQVVSPDVAMFPQSDSGRDGQMAEFSDDSRQEDATRAS